PMIEALLSRLYTADSSFSSRRSVLLPIAIGLTSAYKHYPIALVGKIRPEGFAFEVACPKEGVELTEAMLKNRVCEAERKPGIRAAQVRSLLASDRARAYRVAHEYLPTAEPVEKVNLLETIATLEEKRKNYAAALTAIRQAEEVQELLRREYTEVH